MIEFISKGCTHAVDDVIHNARLQYARERDDFHSFFLNMTSVQVRAILRGQQRSDLRRAIVVRLFEAQQASPHDLWAMLLVQACEECGIDTARISTHSLRKTFVRSVYDASGHDVIKTMKVVQHSSPVITARYLENTESELDDLVLGLAAVPSPCLAAAM